GRTVNAEEAARGIRGLVDMGVENYLITSSVVAVLAQRLVRMICQNCKVKAGMALSPEGELIQTWKGAGCTECGGRGYQHRMGIFEMMEINDEIRKMIV